MVAPEGLEPPTFGLGNHCSIRLSYGANGPPHRVARGLNQSTGAIGFRWLSAGTLERTSPILARSISAK